jgi:hypothetical protein
MECWQVDIGNTVVCDFCGKDYTHSREKGGLIMGSYAVCPRCERYGMLRDADYVSRPRESFRNFVIRTRKYSTVGMCSF